MTRQIDAPSTQMQTGVGQHLQLSQRLMMSAQMQQAIHILQLPLQELEPFIEEQIVDNPILEITSDEEVNGAREEREPVEKETDESEIFFDDKDLAILNHLDEELRDHFADSDPVPVKRSAEEEKLKGYLEQSIVAAPNLREQLLNQAHDTFETPRELEIAEILIGYIDPCGFLDTPLSEISSFHAIPEKEVKKVLREIQSFEPFGIAASTIQESLLIQLRCLGKEETLAYEIVANHYDHLLHNHIPTIQRTLKYSYEEIEHAIANDIAKLDLHPGTHFSAEIAQPIIPDVSLRLEEGCLIVEVERDYTPSLRINKRYLKMLNDPETPKETQHYVKQHLLSAKWLVRNLYQRYSTIERIAQSLAERQHEFFVNPDGQLIPLTMKTLAEELDVHESTIARTVTNKYIFSPRGLLPLRAFFTAKYTSDEGEDLSATTIKEAIRDLIGTEEKGSPLSDEKISFLLKEKGIPCARRTVAKYRLILQIGNAQQRRKFK